MSHLKDLTGQRFGKLAVIERKPNNAKGRAMWLCECECGSRVVCQGSNLLNGHTQSCGCLNVEQSKRINSVHGCSGTRIYKVWKSIKQRCCTPNNERYANYAGRGITICDEWKNDYQSFYDYVSQLPHFNEKGYSIDRINNDGNYEPNNVRWATAKEQANNRRKRSCFRKSKIK